MLGAFDAKWAGYPRRPTRGKRCAARLSTFVLFSSTTLPTWNRAWHRLTRGKRCAARLSTFVLESCLALLMPSGPATPTDRRAANGAPRVLQLSFSFRRPLCRRGIVLDLPHGGLNPAHVSFRLAKTRHSSRAPPPHVSYPCIKPATPPRTFGAFSERIGGRLRRNGVCVCGSASDMHPRSFVRLESCHFFPFQGRAVELSNVPRTGRRVSPLAALSVLDRRTSPRCD